MSDEIYKRLGVDLSKIRKLKPNEIEYLLSWLYDVDIFSNAFPRNRQSIISSWKKVLTLQIEAEKFNPDNLEAIKNELERKFTKGIIESGTPIGKISGTSIGEVASQFTLKIKSNSTATSSGRSTQLSKVFKNYINVPKNPQNQDGIIRFKPDITFLDVFFGRRLYQNINLDFDKFIKSVDVIGVEHLIEKWYSTFEKIYGKQEITSNLGMRLKFNTKKLYEFRIGMADIAKIFTLEDNRCIVFFSPQDIGIVDIYPTDRFRDHNLFSKQVSLLNNIVHDRIYETGEELDIITPEDEYTDDEEVKDILEDIGVYDEEEPLGDVNNFDPDDQNKMEEMFLKSIILPILSRYNFGINVIVKDVSVFWDPYSAAIKDEKKLTDENGDYYRLIFNEDVIMTTNIQISKIIGWLESHGWNVDTDNLPDIIFCSPINVDDNLKSPWTMLKDAIKDISSFNDVVKPYLSVSNGFENLIILKDVDTSHSTTDSAQLMYSIFGIEMARAIQIQNFNELFTGDHWISPLHPLLIADHMTVVGEPIALGSSAYTKIQQNVFERAAFEQQHVALSTGATFPRLEPARTVNTAMMFGMAPPIGSSTTTVLSKPGLILDSNKINEIKTIISAIDAIRLSWLIDDFEYGDTPIPTLKPIEQDEEDIDFELPPLVIPDFEAVVSTPIVEPVKGLKFKEQVYETINIVPNNYPGTVIIEVDKVDPVDPIYLEAPPINSERNVMIVNEVLRQSDEEVKEINQGRSIEPSGITEALEKKEVSEKNEKKERPRLVLKSRRL